MLRNEEVVARFFEKRCAKNRSMESTGNRLYSYSTCIAEWDTDILYVNDTKYSSTTSKHQCHVRYYLKSVKCVFHEDDVPMNTVSLIRFSNKHG